MFEKVPNLLGLCETNILAKKIRKMKHTVTEETMQDSYEQEDTLRRISPQKGGLRTIPFIIVNESFEKVASYGLTPNMILYLTGGYHLESATSTIIVTLWSALSDFLSVLGAFISDSYFGRFPVIVLGSIISLLGMILLWLTAMIPEAKPAPCSSSNICNSPTWAQLAILLSSFGFISFGAGCIRPCSIVFGADQLVTGETVKRDQRVLESYFNGYYVSVGLSAILALTFVVYIQDQFGWKVGFGVPAILMVLSASFFFMGSSLYVKVKADKSVFTGLAQVLVAALKNRHLMLPPDSSDGHYSHNKESKLVAPSDRLRFLNKACIIRNLEEDLNPNGPVSKPWHFCTVDQVEELKSCIRIIPIWSTGIMGHVTMNQGSISVLQAISMNRYITSNFQIPAGSFGTFIVLTLTIWIALYDQIIVPFVTKYTKRPRGISLMHRMGIGLAISCTAMALAAIVESIRRRTAIEQGLSEDPTGVVDMSVLWLVPQFCLSGLAEAFNAVGQIEFYFSELPKSMSSMAVALFTLGTAFSSLATSLIITIVNDVTNRSKNGERISWLSSNLNKGHYDYYYVVLTFLSLLNFVYFLVCCRTYGPSKENRAQASDESEDLKEGLLSKSSEFPSSSSA